MVDKNTQVLLAHHPEGMPSQSDFRIVETEMPHPADGEILVKNLYLSVDPYMRSRMSTAKSYSAGVEIGQVMVGGTVAEVLESKNPDFKPGDIVIGGFGWQQYATGSGRGARKVDPELIPLPAYLGVAGMPGVTAWVGLLEIGQPKAGETVVVSAASGAVGSVVGQLAKMQGCRAVGITGGAEKCRYVMQELSFDACVDYKAGNLYEDLRAAAPNGIDIDFENVGGVIMDTVVQLLNPFARIALCGLVSQYNSTDPQGLLNPRLFLNNRIKLQGFIVGDPIHLPHWPTALSQLAQWVAEGKLKYRENIVEGLENAPQALIDVLQGNKIGKQIVKL